MIIFLDIDVNRKLSEQLASQRSGPTSLCVDNDNNSNAYNLRCYIVTYIELTGIRDCSKVEEQIRNFQHFDHVIHMRSLILSKRYRHTFDDIFLTTVFQ